MSHTPIKILPPRTVDECIRDVESPSVKAALLLCKTMRSISTKGLTYFIAVNSEYVKIGYTQGTVKKRTEDLEKGCPYRYELIGEVPGGKELEQALHSIFSSYRHKDEWFRYEGDLRNFVTIVRGLEGNLK